MEKNTLNIIDLFCGCGGFGLGAHLAGFKTVLAVDIDSTLSSSYKLNFPKANLKNYDLANVSSEQLLMDSGTSQISGVIGGPPCQGFSTMGKRDASDPRNDLMRNYFEHIQNIQPSFFVMENVPGLLSSAGKEVLEQHIKKTSRDYNIVGPIIVDSLLLGASTKRQRVLVIGYKSDAVKDFTEKDILALYAKYQAATVKDAIFDLPTPISISQNVSFGWAKLDKRRKNSAYAAKAKSAPPEGCGWDVALEQMKLGYVSGFMDTQHSSTVKDRYINILPGKADVVSKSVKLKWDGYAPTLRAGTGSDKGSYQAVRPIHPDQGRVITVREAARLQGFPDWFVFHPTKWHSFRMIGNSVSPYMSEAILSFIKSRLVANSSKQLPNPSKKIA